MATDHHQRDRRVRLARNLRESDVLNEILDEIEEGIETDWKTSKDVDTRERAHLKWQVLQEFKKRLEGIVKKSPLMADPNE